MSATDSRPAARLCQVALLSLLLSGCAVTGGGPPPPAASVILPQADTLYLDLGSLSAPPESGFWQGTLRWIAGGSATWELPPVSDLRPDGDQIWASALDGHGVYNLERESDSGLLSSRLLHKQQAAPTGLCPLPDGQGLLLSWSEEARVALIGTDSRTTELHTPLGWFRPSRVLATQSGLWVLDPGHSCLQHFDAAGTWLQELHGPADLPLLAPVDLCDDGQGGIWLLDAWRGGVYHFDREGRPLTGIALRPEGPGSLSLSRSLCRDTRGHLLVLCLDEIRVFSPSGALLARLRNPDSFGDPLLVRTDAKERLLLPQREGGMRILGFRPLHGRALWEAAE